MADEYINKTELLFEMATSLIPQSMDITMGYAIAKDLIRKAPVADVAPVVHGKWSIVWVDQGHIDMEKMYKCSVCGGRKYNDYRYCPECGAYMDGGSLNA